jgi:hypothetical protein
VTPHSNMGASSLARLQRAGTVLSEYMTPEELAGELGICKRTLDRWHSSRTGPPRVTIGRKPLYRRDSVADWIRGKERNFSDQVGRSRRRVLARQP